MFASCYFHRNVTVVIYCERVATSRLSIMANNATTERSRLSLSFARNDADMRDAQRLRYSVFKEEMGAGIAANGERLDRDRFDAHCEHLMIRDEGTHAVVGTYRLLRGERAEHIGGFYAETEFQLRGFARKRTDAIEVGRACVAREYRGGAALGLLWSGVLRFAFSQGYRFVIGCASVDISDGGHAAADLYRQLRDSHLGPREWQTTPHRPLAIGTARLAAPASIPPLLNGYLRLGALIGGEPAWDPEFGSADFFVVLPLERMAPRYARHFQAATANLIAA